MESIPPQRPYHSVSIGHQGTPDGRRLAGAIKRLCEQLSTKSEAQVILEKLIDKGKNVGWTGLIDWEMLPDELEATLGSFFV